MSYNQPYCSNAGLQQGRVYPPSPAKLANKAFRVKNQLPDFGSE